MSDELNRLYRERACLVAHLAVLYPTVMAYNDTEVPDWPVVYIDTPRGQLSWHINPLDLDLFDHVWKGRDGFPAYEWDGHTTEEKYARLAQLTRDTDLGKKVGEEIRRYKR